MMTPHLKNGNVLESRNIVLAKMLDLSKLRDKVVANFITIMCGVYSCFVFQLCPDILYIIKTYPEEFYWSHQQ